MAKMSPLLVQVSPLKQWFYHSGWFFLFIIGGGLLYFYAMEQKAISYREMTTQLSQLEKRKTQVLLAREELLLQIQSQSDPAWVEMVLKRNLGMVREGEVKVYFHNEPICKFKNADF